MVVRKTHIKYRDIFWWILLQLYGRNVRKEADPRSQRRENNRRRRKGVKVGEEELSSSVVEICHSLIMFFSVSLMSTPSLPLSWSPHLSQWIPCLSFVICPSARSLILLLPAALCEHHIFLSGRTRAWESKYCEKGPPCYWWLYIRG